MCVKIRLCRYPLVFPRRSLGVSSASLFVTPRQSEAKNHCAKTSRSSVHASNILPLPFTRAPSWALEVVFVWLLHKISSRTYHSGNAEIYILHSQRLGVSLTQAYFGKALDVVGIQGGHRPVANKLRRVERTTCRKHLMLPTYFDAQCPRLWSSSISSDQSP